MELRMEHDGAARGPAPEEKKRSIGRTLLYSGCGAAILFFVAILCCVGFLFLEFRKSSDPVEIREAFARMTDMPVPDGLTPSTTSSNSRTNLERVEFISPTTNSYLVLTTQKSLEHRSTIQDAYDRGVSAGGGRPENPIQSANHPLNIRGQPAEFLVRRYANFETVSGFFTGKNCPVFLEARFEHEAFPKGMAGEIVQAIQADASRK